MSIFDKYLFKKEKLIKRRIEIDSSLYEKLVELSNEYDAPINKLVNNEMEKLKNKYGLPIYKIETKSRRLYLY